MLVDKLSRGRDVAATSDPIEQRRGKALLYKCLITPKRLILFIFKVCRLRDSNKRYNQLSRKRL